MGRILPRGLLRAASMNVPRTLPVLGFIGSKQELETFCYEERSFILGTISFGLSMEEGERIGIFSVE
jgi:hypothetical protein